MQNRSNTEESFLAALHAGLPQILPEYLLHRRWFGGKARKILSVEVLDVVPIVPIDDQTSRGYLVLVQIRYESGPGDTYDIPLVRLPDTASHAVSDPASVLKFRDENSGENIVLADALSDEQFLTCLLEATVHSASFRGTRGEAKALPTNALDALGPRSQGPLAPSLMKAEQSNTSVLYGRSLILKIFRRVEEGINPDLEIGLFLTEHTSFRNVPLLAGRIEYVSREGARTSLGVFQAYVPNQGDAWQFTLGSLAEYYEKVQSGETLSSDEIPRDSILALTDRPIPDEAKRQIGPYLQSAALLGRRTAELHLALASAQQYPAFTPHAISEAEQIAFVSSATDLLTANFNLLRRLRGDWPDHTRQAADDVLGLEDDARRRLQLFADRKLSALLTRIHGDYHLGQVLFTGSDFVIIDFEGEPARPLEERRKKRSPLQDAAGMLRSFHYAAYAPLLQQRDGQQLQNSEILGVWADYWQKWVSATFLKAYLEFSGGSQFIPQSREELALLLDAYLLDKAVYELGYELNNRPSWVGIPLEGISQLLASPVPTSKE
jgi:maltose alpha-D-glucosyltransferase/alpha-amylase